MGMTVNQLVDELSALNGGATVVLGSYEDQVLSELYEDLDSETGEPLVVLMFGAEGL